MELKAKTENRTLTLQLRGELDHHAAKKLVREIDLVVEREVPQQLVPSALWSPRGSRW